MNSKQVTLLKSILGCDVFEDLAKFEIYKPETRTVVDPNEIRVALQIVPRTILSFLVLNLKKMNKGDSLELELPFASATLHVNKLSSDNYNGTIHQDNRIVSEFKNRSLPSIGLIIMSSFELYDVESVNTDEYSERNSEVDQKLGKLQHIIEERIRLHSLVSEVIEQKLSEREAIQRLISEKIKQQTTDIIDKFSMVKDVSEKSKEYDEDDSESEDKDLNQSILLDSSMGLEGNSTMSLSEKDNKFGKLKDFLEKRKKKIQDKAVKSAHSDVDLDKSEIKCPDCDTRLYGHGDKSFRLCICYGDYQNKQVKIYKKEGKIVSLKFPKSFESENIEMLSEALKGKKIKRIYG